jgi:hypothetical protein
MQQEMPVRLALVADLLILLTGAARETAVSAVKHYRARGRKPIGATLRPGPDTPLWNEFAKLAAGQLQRYGDKARLARILGVPRQRVHEYFVAHTACPDTERALRLLVWLLEVPESGRPGPKPAAKVSRIT